jgi:hypothetical protein
MDFLISAGMITREGFEVYRAEEDQVVDELRAEGVLSAAYRRADGAGVFGIAHGADLAAVKAQLARRERYGLQHSWISGIMHDLCIHRCDRLDARVTLACTAFNGRGQFWSSFVVGRKYQLQ